MAVTKRRAFDFQAVTTTVESLFDSTNGAAARTVMVRAPGAADNTADAAVTANTSRYLVNCEGLHAAGEYCPVMPGERVLFKVPRGAGNGGGITKVTGKMASGTGTIAFAVVEG